MPLRGDQRWCFCCVWSALNPSGVYNPRPVPVPHRAPTHPLLLLLSLPAEQTRLRLNCPLLRRALPLSIHSSLVYSNAESEIKHTCSFTTSLHRSLRQINSVVQTERFSGQCKLVVPWGTVLIVLLGPRRSMQIPILTVLPRTRDQGSSVPV